MAGGTTGATAAGGRVGGAAAAVAPPTFVLFTDKDVKLHFAFERFLANQIHEALCFIGSPIWFKTRPRNKKKPEE
jgi:GTP-binding protein